MARRKALRSRGSQAWEPSQGSGQGLSLTGGVPLCRPTICGAVGREADGSSQGLDVPTTLPDRTQVHSSRAKGTLSSREGIDHPPQEQTLQDPGPPQPPQPSRCRELLHSGKEGAPPTRVGPHRMLMNVFMGARRVFCREPRTRTPSGEPQPPRIRGLLFRPPSRISSAAWMTRRRVRQASPPKP